MASDPGIPHPAFGGNVASISHLPFLMPGGEHVMEPFTILTGQILARGSVLGQITSTGKLILSLNAASDGSQVPMAILGEDLDTSTVAGDVNFQVYVHGKFNPEALVFGTGQTEANTKALMRDAGIYYEHPF